MGGLHGEDLPMPDFKDIDFEPHVGPGLDSIAEIPTIKGPEPNLKPLIGVDIPTSPEIKPFIGGDIPLSKDPALEPSGLSGAGAPMLRPGALDTEAGQKLMEGFKEIVEATKELKDSGQLIGATMPEIGETTLDADMQMS